MIPIAPQEPTIRMWKFVAKALSCVFYGFLITPAYIIMQIGNFPYGIEGRAVRGYRTNG